MKKRHRDRNLAAGHYGKPKELTQRDCGSRRKLAATCRKMSHHVRVAWHKRNIIMNNCIRDIVKRGTQTVGMLRKKLW
jgi:hypothetical protein